MLKLKKPFNLYQWSVPCCSNHRHFDFTTTEVTMLYVVCVVVLRQICTRCTASLYLRVSVGRGHTLLPPDTVRENQKREREVRESPPASSHTHRQTEESHHWSVKTEEMTEFASLPTSLTHFMTTACAASQKPNRKPTHGIFNWTSSVWMRTKVKKVVL